MADVDLVAADRMLGWILFEPEEASKLIDPLIARQQMEDERNGIDRTSQERRRLVVAEMAYGPRPKNA